MKVTLVHAYSRKNAGDGLLVDLALAFVHEALAPDAVTLVALDPQSFDALGVRVLPWGRASNGGRLGLLTAGLLGPSDLVADELASSDLIVGVGGGYLRGGEPAELIKTAAAHLRQLHAVSRAGAPAVYLPQSIGPFPAAIQRRVKSELSRLACVMVRDDASAREYAMTQTRRFPDSVLLQLGDQPLRERHARTSGATVLVPRRLSNPRTYESGLRALVALLAPVEWAAQSLGRGNDDVSFIGEFSDTPPPQLLSRLDEGNVAVVVSARLHGALQSILAGVPAVHLSYERKGFAAYADLGLDDFVFNARSFAPDDVRRAVESIRRDPTAYWELVDAARPRLAQARADLIAELRFAAGRSRP